MKMFPLDVLHFHRNKLKQQQKFILVEELLQFWI